MVNCFLSSDSEAWSNVTIRFITTFGVRVNREGGKARSRPMQIKPDKKGKAECVKCEQQTAMRIIGRWF